MSIGLLLSCAVSVSVELAPPTFQVVGGTAANQIVTIRQLSPDATLIGHATKDVRTADWLVIERRSRSVEPSSSGETMRFTQGDRVAVRLTDLMEERAVFSLSADLTRRPWRLPFSAIASWHMVSPDPLRRASDSDVPLARDRVTLRSGSAVEGTLEVASRENNSVMIQTANRKTTLSLADVEMIEFNPELARIRRPKGKSYRVFLTDGSRLTATGLEGDPWFLTVTPHLGEPVRFAWAVVERIVVQSAGTVSVGRLVAVERSGAVGSVGSPGKTSSEVDEHRRVRIRRFGQEREYDLPITLAADSFQTFELPTEAKRVYFVAGMEVGRGDRGSAVLRVLVDGKSVELPGKGLLRGDEESWSAEVDVTAARRIRFELGQGPGGPVQDRVHLVNVIAVR